MNYPFGVGGIECVGDLECDLQHLAQWHAAADDAIFQSLAFEIFHGQKREALVFADIVNGANVWVIEGGGGAGFAAETIEGLRIVRGFFREEFQGDHALETGVFGFVNDAHAAAADFFEDAVMGNRAAEHG